MTVAIRTEPIDAAALLERVGTDADGAAILFVGRVRDHNDGRTVRGLHYDAYVPMAEKVLAEIADEAKARISRAGGPGDPPPRLAVVHRIGELAIGEASVAIAVATPHRAEAFDACRYVIEEIKRRLPVWKQERYVDGADAWLDGALPTPDEREPSDA